MDQFICARIRTPPIIKRYNLSNPKDVNKMDANYTSQILKNGKLPLRLL